MPCSPLRSPLPRLALAAALLAGLLAAPFEARASPPGEDAAEQRADPPAAETPAAPPAGSAETPPAGESGAAGEPEPSPPVETPAGAPTEVPTPEPAPPGGPAAEKPIPPSGPRPGTPVDAGHAALERLLGRALAFDRFFGDDGDLDPIRARSWVALRGDLRLRQEEDPAYTVALRASLRFPGLERWLRDRLRLVVDGISAEPEMLVPDGEPPPPDEPRLGQDAAALLRYAFVDRLGFDLAVSAGVLLRLPPDAVVRVRARYAVPAGDLFLGRLALVPFWRTDLGLGATASADVQRELGRATLVRLGGSATANEEEWSRGLQWSSELALLRSFGRGAAASLAWGVRGVTRPLARTESHRVYLRARRTLLRPWLFVEVEPEAVWPLVEPDVEGPVFGVLLRLEVQVQAVGDAAPRAAEHPAEMTTPLTPTLSPPRSGGERESGEASRERG